ncbi:MAG: hypothetical protein ACM31L_09175 [Actinomycetota bacterium]
MKVCHVCRRPWLDHAPDCRVLADLDRMRRVFARLVAENREAGLSRKIGTYLEEFGKLPCQQHDGLPDSHDCDACGHREVCVIMPPEAKS